MSRIQGIVWVCLLMVQGAVMAESAMIPAPPVFKAEGYLLMDAVTGKVLVEFNAEQRLPPASLTKIMTSYVAAQELARGRIKLDDQVLVSVKAWRMEGSRMFVREGTRVSLEDLLRGIIIQSGNDASVALAEHAAGSEDAYADLMNQYGARLGMRNTNFVNVTGLPHENHYSTAEDMARLTAALVREFPEHYRLYAEKSFTYGGIAQPNRNRLLMQDSSVDGVKTGYTEAAGYCLIASAVRDDMRLISVVMNAPSEGGRMSESQKLLSYGFRYYETASIYDAGEILKPVRVWGGKQQAVNLGVTEDVAMTIPRGSRSQLKAAINQQAAIHAPLDKGEKLGELTVNIMGGESHVFPVRAMNSVQEGGFFTVIWDAIQLFFLKLFGGDPFAYQP